MGRDNARSLKHDLRTPVNHILGYVSLIAETADDTGDESFSRQIEEIRILANEINKEIERALLASTSIGLQDIEAMRNSVSPLITRLMNGLDVTSTPRMDDSSLADFARIRSAAGRLQALLQ